MYCPDWIFEIVSAEVAALYLKNDITLELGARKYATGLSGDYEELSADEIAMLSEEMIRTLGELEAGEAAVTLLDGFSFFRLFYNMPGVKRNLKPLEQLHGTKEKEYMKIL